MRTTLSSDIRAPGIAELFSPILVATQTISYPNGGPSFNVKELQAGNPLLQPEQAETVEGGIVLRVVKRMGRLLDERGRSTGVIPINIWDDSLCDPVGGEATVRSI